MLKRRAARKEKPGLIREIAFLRKKGDFWFSVAAQLAKPRRKAAKVNLEKLNKLTREGEVIVVPGKILSSGKLSHALTVGAFSISEKTKEKLKDSGSKLFSIKELASKYIGGKGVKIIT